MRLKNKKTGEIVSLEGELVFDNEVMLLKQYSSLAELNAEWGDYEELEYWYIDDNGDILLSDLDDDESWKDLAEQRKLIGNYFSSREEAELAVRKLKAWKRLKDRGFRFTGYTSKDRGTITEFEIYCDTGKPCIDRDEFTDLDLLFSGGGDGN